MPIRVAPVSEVEASRFLTTPYGPSIATAVPRGGVTFCALSGLLLTLVILKRRASNGYRAWIRAISAFMLPRMRSTVGIYPYQSLVLHMLAYTIVVAQMQVWYHGTYKS
jgi:hypothetical protein